ncbi:YihY/virulence factor BrkB family protein [Halobium salinum]|uniref:YihY/virulence factor BrkB family protein n=1 Tax=Halobium salinum TaxID=1364940 RepID=A0ABD5PHH1_9EURY|nr:YihY/virulence factor BrkB family protein [Halobium salinum]
MDTAATTSTLKTIVATARAGNLPFLAGSLAFHAFVSLLPLLLLALVFASVFAGEFLTEYVLRITAEYLSPAGQSLVLDAVVDASESAGGSVLGVAVLLWSSVRIFRGVDVAFDQLYGVTEPEPLPRQLRDALVGLVAVVAAVALVSAAAAAFALLPARELLGPLSPLLVALGLATVFFPVYYLFPPVDIPLREAVPGAVTAAVGWSVLQASFQVYVSFSSYDAYGALGGVLVLLIWLYFSGLILLLGVVVNVVLGEADVEPVEAPPERLGFPRVPGWNRSDR